MNKRIGPYHVVDLPPGRRAVLNFLNLSSWAHYIFALLEVDVTVARQLMDEYEARTGEKLSFTGYLTFCLARAIDEDRSVQAYLNSKGQFVVFDDVDVGMMIERQMGETRAPVGYVIRRANHKTYMEIHREIRAVQAGQALQRENNSSRLALLRRLPGPLRNLSGAFVRRAIRRDPAGMWVPMAGTVAVTAVGMFGNGSGWGLAAPAGHSLCLIVGGIARKPAVVQDRVEPRQILSLTVAFDHDIVDGAPAARFSQCLKELIECGYGLDEERTTSSSDAEAVRIRNTS